MDSIVIIPRIQLVKEIEKLKKLIEYWKSYPCKFDCRKTNKNNWMQGYIECQHNNARGMHALDAIEAWNQKEKDNARTRTSDSKRS